MAQLFVNNYRSTLAAQLNAGATSCQVASATGLPTPTGGDYFLLTLYGVSGITENAWEIVKCTARSGTTLTIVRAQEGTTDATWASGTPAELRLTAGSLSSAGIGTLDLENLKLSRGANNVVNILAASSGAAPASSHAVTIPVPDGAGMVMRSRAAAYLSGASAITLADAAGYWGRSSANGSRYTAYLYAIWDGTGIVWALGGYSGMVNVPTTTTAADDNYLLLEDSSTYTRNAAHYCVCVGKLAYEYDTADTPDHTINATSFRLIYDRDPADWYLKVVTDAAERVTSSTVAGYVDVTGVAATFTPPRTGWYEAEAIISNQECDGISSGILTHQIRFRLSDGAVTGGEVESVCFNRANAGAGTQHGNRRSINVKHRFFCPAGTAKTTKLQESTLVAASGNWSYAAIRGDLVPTILVIREVREGQ